MYRDQLYQPSGNPCKSMTSGPSVGPAWTTCSVTSLVSIPRWVHWSLLCCSASIFVPLLRLFAPDLQSLFFNLLPQLEQPLDERFRARRAARNIDIDRHQC